MNFTILTPIYNRSSYIDRLHQNLSIQTGNIEWIIVNDGSTDNLDEEIEKIQKFPENKQNLNIHYLKKGNGGKHSAVNLGLKFSTSDWTIILDSDDKLSENCLQIVQEKIKSLSPKQIEEISGFIFLKSDINGKIVGQKFSRENIPLYHYDLAKIKGDKFRVTKTQILQKNPSPIFKNETFVTEATVWNVVEAKNPVIAFNFSLCIVEYLSGGMTSSYDKLIEQNCQGTFHYIKTSLKLTSFNFFRDLGLYRNILGHYFHIRSFEKSVMIMKIFKTKGIFFLSLFLIYRTVVYFFYKDFKKRKL